MERRRGRVWVGRRRGVRGEDHGQPTTPLLLRDPSDAGAWYRARRSRAADLYMVVASTACPPPPQGGGRGASPLREALRAEPRTRRSCVRLLSRGGGGGSWGRVWAGGGVSGDARPPAALRGDRAEGSRLHQPTDRCFLRGAVANPRTAVAKDHPAGPGRGRVVRVLAGAVARARVTRPTCRAADLAEAVAGSRPGAVALPRPLRRALT